MFSQAIHLLGSALETRSAANNKIYLMTSTHLNFCLIIETIHTSPSGILQYSDSLVRFMI